MRFVRRSEVRLDPPTGPVVRAETLRAGFADAIDRGNNMVNGPCNFKVGDKVISDDDNPVTGTIYSIVESYGETLKTWIWIVAIKDANGKKWHGPENVWKRI